MNRLRLEARAASGCSHEFRRFRQIKVDQRSATGADRVVVPVSLTIVSAGRVSERNLVYEARLFQKTQGVVDRRIAYRGEKLASLLKHLTSRGMMIAFVYYAKNNLALRGESRFFSFVSPVLDRLLVPHS